jgi:Skp family chaperone for outer membrane proteins
MRPETSTAPVCTGFARAIRRRFAAGGLASLVLAVAVLALAGSLWKLADRPVGASAASLQPEASAVATVELRSLLERLDEHEQIMQQFEAFRQEQQDTIQRLRDELDQMQQDLDVVAPAERAERQQEIIRKAKALEGEREIAELFVEVRGLELQRPLFDKIFAAIEEYAEEEGYDLVLADDRGLRIPRDVNLRGLEAAVLAKTVLYASDAIDITEAVALRMNRDFQQGP